MTSIDANILLYSYSEASPHHAAAKAFLESLSQRDDVALSEFILSEVYLHLRNPAVLEAPLSPAKAVAVIQSDRQHPRWRVLGFPPAAATSTPRFGKPPPLPISPAAASTTSAPPSASMPSASRTSPRRM